ncbi:MlaA family lipoprotein [Desertibaculum subflavum]|uniref:MlaA family lipoprotein n=1 Tax=Desertibaculum subflavum TaxID=2268458 RepID=UPI000E666154
MKFAGAAAVAALVIALTGAAAAQTALPPDLDARLQSALVRADRNDTTGAQAYGGLANPLVAEQGARQARQRAEAERTRAVLAAIAERPDLGPAIVERAAALAPASAANIRAAAYGAYPGMGGAPPPAATPLPGQWYAPIALGPRWQPAPTVTRVAAAAPSGPAVPASWYDQPLLRRYGAGAPPAPTLAMAPSIATDAPAVEEIDAVWDPLEGLNRVFHGFNQGLDFILLRPVAWTYSHLPGEIKGVVRNALFNLREPLNFANSLLQGELTYAGRALGRFVTNSTIGVAGLADVADNIFGIPPSRADFGQTLYVWGLGAGPYIEAPLLGPTNARDLVGTAVELVGDPFNYVILDQTARYVRAGTTIVSVREELLVPLDELKAGSVDYYVALREASQARRKVELTRGKAKMPVGGGKAADELFDEAK